MQDIFLTKPNETCRLLTITGVASTALMQYKVMLVWFTVIYSGCD